MIKILIVAGDFPYPPNHGGRKDIWERIKLLKKMNYKINLITALYDTNVPLEDLEIVKKSVNEVRIIKREKRLRYMFSLLPYQIKSRKNLKKTTLKEKYDFVILEGEDVLPIIWNRDLKGSNHIIYRMHNNEVNYFKALCNSERNFLKKIYYYIESLKFSYVKNKYLKSFENIWFISKDEMKNYKFNNINGLFVPPQVEKKSLKIKNIYDNNVLFLGSLFMINNQEAIIWYLKNIHDFLSETVNDYKLTIAGNTRNQAIEWLRKKIRTCKYNNNIQIYDTPSDLEDIYKNNSIFINPMLNGAGVKLKTIEAIKYGLLIVSTKIGIEGTGLRNGEHVLVGNDVEKFKMGLLKLIRMDYSKKKQLSLNSQEYIEEEFDNTDKIKKYLNDLVEIDNEKS